MFKWWSLRGGWIICMRNSEWCRKLVPKMRWSMSGGAVSDFEWWWWFDQSDIRWRACVVTVRRLNRYEVIQIQRLSSTENFVSQRDDFIFNSFRNFKPVKRFQNRSDVLEFSPIVHSMSLKNGAYNFSSVMSLIIHRSYVYFTHKSSSCYFALFE